MVPPSGMAIGALMPLALYGPGSAPALVSKSPTYTPGAGSRAGAGSIGLLGSLPDVVGLCEVTGGFVLRVYARRLCIHSHSGYRLAGGEILFAELAEFVARFF